MATFSDATGTGALGAGREEECGPDDERAYKLRARLTAAPPLRAL